MRTSLRWLAAAGTLAGTATGVFVAQTPLGLPANPPRSLLITHARVFDPDNGLASGPDMQVLIRGGVVAGVGTKLRQRAPAGTETIDAEGRFVLPGLIDVHTHMLRAGSCGRDEGIGIANIRQVALNLDQTLAHGTTTAVDLGAPLGPVLGLRSALAREGSLAPRLIAAGPVLTAPGGYPLDWADPDMAHDLDVVVEVGSVDEARAAVDRLADEGVDVIKVASMERSYNERPLPALSGPPLAAVVSEAHERRLRVFAHAHSVAGYRAALDARVDVIAHSSFEPLPDEIIDEIAQRGVPVVPTLWVFAAFEVARHDPKLVPSLRDELLPPFYDALIDFDARAAAAGDDIPPDFLPGLHRTRLAEANLVAEDNLARLAAAGAIIAMGTDTSFCYALHDSAPRELERMRHAGLSATEALVAATLGSAKALGRTDLGRIRTGNPADLLLLDGDPRSEPSVLDSPWLVIRSGRPLERRPAPPGLLRSLRWLASFLWWSA